MSVDEAVWEFLPARKDRRRTTVPSVIAANLGLPVPVVVAALLRMEGRRQVVADPRGSWHRGLPITPATEGVS